jgi:hypothetical protein
MAKTKIKTKSTNKVKKVKKTSGNSAQVNPQALMNKMFENLKLKAAKKSKPSLSSILSDIGGYAGDVIPRMIWGRGAYKMSQNSMFDVTTQSQVPMMHSNSESVTFRHREYICDISSSTTFNTTVFSINPGLAATFPYLSGIAQNFQEYEFKGLVYEFKSTSADALNSTNTALGTVMLAAQYRADAAPFINKEQLLNEMWSVDTKPSCNVVLPIECSPAENPLSIQYIRANAVPAGQDTKLYDLASVTVATYGSQAVCDIGELWASYEVVLRKPQLSGAINLYGLGAHYVCSGVTSALPLGTSFVSKIDSIGLVLTSTTITLPLQTEGTFIVYYVNHSSGTFTSSNSNFTYTNATPVGTVSVNTPNSYVFLPENGAVTDEWSYYETFKVLDNTKACRLTAYTAGTIATGTATADVYIYQVPFSSV